MIEVQTRITKVNFQTFAEYVARELKIPDCHKILITINPTVRKAFDGADGVTMKVGPVYWVQIQSTLSFNDIGKTICHEMVHVKDFISGKMKIVGEGKRSWCGKVYDIETTPYLDQPWEQHAMSLEVSLFHRVITKKDQDDVHQS